MIKCFVRLMNDAMGEFVGEVSLVELEYFVEAFKKYGVLVEDLECKYTYSCFVTEPQFGFEIVVEPSVVN